MAFALVFSEKIIFFGENYIFSVVIIKSGRLNEVRDKMLFVFA